MTSGADFFRQSSLPAPKLDEDWAARVAREHFGLDARAESLGSQQDTNFLLRAADGTVAAVLKVANPAFGALEIEAQDEAADLVARHCPDLRVATVLRGTDGGRKSVVVEESSGPLVVRMIRFLDGGTLADAGHLPPPMVARLGELSARVSLALRGFEHPGLDRVLQWDLRYADRATGILLDHLPAARRRQVETAVGDAWAAVQQVAADLPLQPVHLDITDDNLVRALSGPSREPDGLIDFSDLTATWAVSELAITIASVLHHTGAEPCSVLPAVRAFHRLRPLSPAEAGALWPLTVLRTASLVLSGSQQIAIDQENAYASERVDGEWRMFDQAVSVPLEVMTGLVREAAGLSRTRPRLPAHANPLVPGAAAPLSLAWDADALDEGAWSRPGIVAELAAARLATGATGVVTTYAEARLAGSPRLSATSPATVATGVEAWFASPVEITAPWSGTLTASGDGLALESADAVLRLSAGEPPSAAPGADVEAGATLFSLPAGAGLRVVLQTAGAPDVPPLVRPEYAAGWLGLTADPSPLLGRPAAAGTTEDPDLLERREASFATVQEHYYDRPPRIERGWRHRLITTEGRVLLDMVNNVAIVGHSHPRLEAAASRQLRLLNTNSRFNYGAVVDFAERLAALVPDPLDTVFLVNSGSEAADLALRLAMADTDRHDIVAMREAYHGWTYAADAVSTSVADNPNALTTRPDWVHTVEAPNSFRGRHRGADTVQYAAEAARFVDDLAASGRPPAAFIAEAYYGNAGGMPLPDGYLAEVYAAVRRHGGLVIADEIQVGYGRLGQWFWGFEQQGVVPDIVTVAKAVGNGHPVGAVITSRAVADRYRNAGYFFSSTGGSPVSSVIGSTVLDIVRDEGLQENARVVGARLKARLLALAERHPIVGAVHGSGLYLGVELVRDPATLEPATEETYAICERMLQLGVVIQPTGDRNCVLKVKPPLCLDAESADFFVDTLDQVLTEGW
ncbi:MAG: aminotransferase [Actinoallomurus sp.]